MKKIIIFLLLLAVFLLPFALISCGEVVATTTGSTTAATTEAETESESSLANDEEVYFFIRWGVFGISSYDSKTGVLIKTTDVIEHSPDDYKTTLILSDEQKDRISEIIKELDIESYPDEYDPYADENGESWHSMPSQTLVLSTGTKTVSCANISLGLAPAPTEKGKNFLQAIDEIVKIITSSDEWKALPEYEIFYD